MGQQQPSFKVSLSHRAAVFVFCLDDTAAPRPVPPIAHDSTTTAARKGANDSHNLVSPWRSNSSYSTSPSPCRLAATSMPGRESTAVSQLTGRDTAGVNRRTPAARPQARSSWAVPTIFMPSSLTVLRSSLITTAPNRKQLGRLSCTDADRRVPSLLTIFLVSCRCMPFLNPLALPQVSSTPEYKES